MTMPHETPDAGVPTGEPGRSRRISTIEGCVSTLHGTLIGGSLLTAYALALGASDFHIGLIAGFGMVANIGLLLGARSSLRRRARKPVVVRAALASRMSWALLTVIPFLPLSPTARVWVFLSVVLAAQTLLQMAVNPWSDWIADLAPEHLRGRFFGMRNAVCGGVGMIGAILVGRSYDALKSFVHPGQELWVFVPFFGGTAVLAVLSAWLYTRQWEPPMREAPILPMRDLLLSPLRHPPYRALIRFQVCWAVACAIGGPFFGAHMIRNLHMSMSTIAVYGILAGAVGLFSQPLWGRVVDRYGNRPVLMFNMVVVFTMPLIWLFATPDFLFPVWADALLTGLCWPGLNMALFNLVLGTAPAENRQGYLAAQGVISGAAHFLAAAIGGGLAHGWSEFRLVIGQQTLVNFHLLFILSAFGRLLMLPAAMRLHEPRAMSVKALVSGWAGLRYRFSGMILSGIGQAVTQVRRRPRQ
ncbi:MAG: MFS transporter [Kiritimatiellae bacterium]|nr:MFS transporter [Kiritimatiellia bacterium]